MHEHRTSGGDAVAAASRIVHPKPAGEDPLFVLYTSGSTGKPKGVHTTGGYLVYAAPHLQYVFDYHEGGHLLVYRRCGLGHRSPYLVYGPLANGATTVMFEGVPELPGHQPHEPGGGQAPGQHPLIPPHRHPRPDGHGQEDVEGTSRTSLRIMGLWNHQPGSLGWYCRTIGGRALPIVDTWWQTETGSILILPARRHRPQARLRHLPFFWVQPALVDNLGQGAGGPPRATW